MGQNTATEIPVFTPNEVRLCSVSFDEELDEGESLTGTPTVTEETTSDLTLANKSVSTAALTILGESISAGRAVQFKVSGQIVANSPYTIRIKCGTNSDPAQIVEGFVKFRVVDS